MAIGHFKASIVSRRSGASSVAHAAYIHRCKMHDNRLNETFDYSARGEYLNASKREEVVSFQFHPKNAPKWVKDGVESMWDGLEKREDKFLEKKYGSNKEFAFAMKEKAQVYESIIVALPKEFGDPEIAQKYLKDYVEKVFIKQGLVGSVAIHWNDENPHGHIQASRRGFDNNGKLQQAKNREIVSRAGLMMKRELFEASMNLGLAEIGSNERINLKSFKNQGVALSPTKKEGIFARHAQSKGEFSKRGSYNEAVRAKNAEIILDNPSEILTLLSTQKGVFTRSDVVYEITKRMEGNGALINSVIAKLESQIKGVADGSAWSELLGKVDGQTNDNVELSESHEEFKFVNLVNKYTDLMLRKDSLNTASVEALKTSFRDEGVYGSTAYIEKENQVFSDLDQISKKSNHKVGEGVIALAIENIESELKAKNPDFKGLNDERQQVITKTLQGSNLSIIEGWAGTGKTTITKALVKGLQDSDYDVMLTSFQASAVGELSKATGVKGYTLHSLMYKWHKHESMIEALKNNEVDIEYAAAVCASVSQYQIRKNSVVIVDEASMVSLDLIHELVTRVHKEGAKVILIGDSRQISPIQGGEIYRALCSRYGAEELRDIVRQNVPWMREASKLLNEHKLEDGLLMYADPSKRGILSKLTGGNDGQSRVHFFANAGEVVSHAVERYVQNEAFRVNTKEFIKSNIILSHKNEVISYLNAEIRSRLQNEGAIENVDYYLAGNVYSVGERIVFTRNDNKGTFVKKHHE